MSHFFTMVLLPAGDVDIEDRDQVQRCVEGLIEYYDEKLSVPEYETDCGCGGRLVARAAMEAADKEAGKIDEYRERYWKIPADDRPEWEVFTADWQKVYERVLAAYPKPRKPDGTCGFYTGERQSWWPNGAKAGDRFEDGSGCGGTGKYRTTYNPNSKWDWCEIGGRWTAVFDKSYDPTKDSRNIEECFICKGTGKRDDKLGQEARLKDPTYTCNGCDGTGKSVKFQLAPFHGDVRPIAQVPNDVIPFAIVTPDGRWHERGKMGWFGMASNEKAEEAWASEVKAIREKWKDTVAVVVDMHI